MHLLGIHEGISDLVGGIEWGKERVRSLYSTDATFNRDKIWSGLRGSDKPNLAEIGGHVSYLLLRVSVSSFSWIR